MAAKQPQRTTMAAAAVARRRVERLDAHCSWLWWLSPRCVGVVTHAVTTVQWSRTSNAQLENRAHQAQPGVGIHLVGSVRVASGGPALLGDSVPTAPAIDASRSELSALWILAGGVRVV